MYLYTDTRIDAPRISERFPAEIAIARAGRDDRSTKVCGSAAAEGIQALTARLEVQAAQIHKVSAQLEVRKSSPQIVLNNQ